MRGRMSPLPCKDSDSRQYNVAEDRLLPEPMRGREILLSPCLNQVHQQCDISEDRWLLGLEQGGEQLRAAYPDVVSHLLLWLLPPLPVLRCCFGALPPCLFFLRLTGLLPCWAGAEAAAWGAW